MNDTARVDELRKIVRDYDVEVVRIAQFNSLSGRRALLDQNRVATLSRIANVLDEGWLPHGR